MLYKVAFGSMVEHWPTSRIFVLCSREREDTELPHIRNYPGLPYTCMLSTSAGYGGADVHHGRGGGGLVLV